SLARQTFDKIAKSLFSGYLRISDKIKKPRFGPIICTRTTTEQTALAVQQSGTKKAQAKYQRYIALLDANTIANEQQNTPGDDKNDRDKEGNDDSVTSIRSASTNVMPSFTRSDVSVIFCTILSPNSVFVNLENLSNEEDIDEQSIPAFIRTRTSPFFELVDFIFKKVQNQAGEQH
ncbi:hypothetical protein BGX21_000815, partial [Mortierella sp. AD011]